MKKSSRLIVYFLVLTWVLVAQFEWTQRDLDRQKSQAQATPAEPDSLPPAQPEPGTELD